MKLTDLVVKRLKSTGKKYKRADGKGLAILVRPDGGKSWIVRYRFNGEPFELTLGLYPRITLGRAREQLKDVKDQIAEGINPIVKKAQDKENEKTLDLSPADFETIFYEWQGIKKHDWTDRYTKKMTDRMKLDVFQVFKRFDIEDITPQIAIKLLKKIEGRGVAYSAKRIRQDCSRVFKYAVGMGYIDRNPFGDLPLDIFKTVKPKNFAHMVDLDKIGKLLHDIRHYKGSFEVVTALKLLPHIFLRVSELVEMPWDEVDIEARQIRIKAERMKNGKPHIVPMSDQVLSHFQTLKKLNGDKDYVFWSPLGKSGHINAESPRLGLRRMGYGSEEITSHGFRHMASTHLNELGYRSDLTELQLSHQIGSQVRSTYNHAELLPERTVMMREWSNYLDSLIKHSTA